MLDKDRACLRITRRTQPSPRGGKSAPLALSAALLVVLAHASPCAAAGLRNAGAPGSEAASLLGGTNLTTSHGVHGGQPGVTAGRDDAATTRMGQLSDAPARRASKALPPPAFDVISAVAHRARAGRRLQTLATSVAGGGFHSLVVLSDGTLRAFGINAFGQLGYGTTSDVGDKQATLPIDQGAVPLGGLAVAVAAGYHHSVVLLVDGSVRAFGFGLIGRLGYGSAANVGDTPDTLPSVQGGVHLGGEAVAVAAGYAHTLVATASGKAFAFGGGAYGMLGYGTNSDVGGKPETLPYSVGPVPLDGNAVAVAAGQYHSLVLLDDGSLWAFGSGEDGKLGYGNSFDVGGTPETLPSEKGPVQLGGKAVAVAAGRSHSLVLLENGTVCAFGQGSQGRLGNGATAKVGNKLATLPSTQAPLSLGGKAVAVAAGEEHSVVLLEDGTVRAFGSGQNGRLGYGDTSNVGDKPETLPSEQGAVSLGGKAVAVAAGNAHSVVMLEDGTARTFGNGMYGKLGYGETSHVGDTPETQPSEKGPVPLVTPSPTPSSSPSPSATPSSSATASASPSVTASPTPTASSSVTASPTQTASSSVTASPTPTASSSVTASPTQTASSSVTASPTPTASSSVSASATSTASPSASPTASGAATGSIGNTDDGTQPADDGGVSAFVVIGAVAGAALLLGGAAWAMKRVGLASWTGGSAPSAAVPTSAGAGAVQQTGSGEASAVGGASGLSSIGVQSPASGSRV